MASIDYYIQASICSQITEIAATMKQKTIEQGKSMFGIRCNTATIDSMDFRQTTLNVSYDTTIFDSEREAAMFSENGWMVFKVEEINLDNSRSIHDNSR